MTKLEEYKQNNSIRILAKIKAGSQLYGVATPESDTDYAGIFMQDIKHVLGLHKMEELDLSSLGAKLNTRNTHEDVDEKYFALNKFLHLCASNNPTILEYLFAPDESIIEDSDEYKFLRMNANKFLSQRVLKSFGGYAYGEKKRIATKSKRFKQLAQVITYLEEQSDIADDKALVCERWDTLEEIASYYKGSKQNCNVFHDKTPLKAIYELLVKEYDEFGWRLHTSSFAKVGYDVKAGYHLIRLLHEGAEILRTGKIVLPLTGLVYNDIMKIRNGEVSFDDLMDLYDEYKNAMDEAAEVSILPEKPDMEWIDGFQITAYREHILKEGGDELPSR